MDCGNKFSNPMSRMCHPVNIYVFKTGVADVRPQLVHIPTDKKKNMNTILEAIQDRIKLPVGYPVALYNMDGSRVCKPWQLQMYNNYVVTTNLERRFKCVHYGCVNEPLVVVGHHSKHVKALDYENKRFDLFCRRKWGRKPLHEALSNKEPDGYGPCNLPLTGKPCGALCYKIQPHRCPERQTQCCSDEIMCVEGNNMDLNVCDETEAEDQQFQDKELQDLAQKVQGQSQGPSQGFQAENQLGDLVKRYKEVGSDIFKMFQDKITIDLSEDLQNSTKWKLPSEDLTLRNEMMEKVKNDLLGVVDNNCDFMFDAQGQYIPTEQCRIGRTPNQKDSGPKPSPTEEEDDEEGDDEEEGFQVLPLELQLDTNKELLRNSFGQELPSEARNSFEGDLSKKKRNSRIQEEEQEEEEEEEEEEYQPFRAGDKHNSFGSQGKRHSNGQVENTERRNSLSQALGETEEEEDKHDSLTKIIKDIDEDDYDFEYEDDEY